MLHAAATIAQNIDHVPVGIAKEEATDSPRLVGQRVDYLRAGTNGSCMAGVHVIDLDGNSGMTGAVSSCVIGLSCAPGRSGSAKVRIQPWSITG